jgi:hypothetical protein
VFPVRYELNFYIVFRRNSVFKGLWKMTSTVLLKRGKHDGIAVYVPTETNLKEMADKIE